MNSTAPLPTFVLVPGMWHRAASWAGVADLLEMRGYRCIAVDLPGMGRSDGDDTFAGQVRYLTGVLEATQGPVIACAHSYGGTVLTEAASARRTPAVSKLIYVAAHMPAEGESTASITDAGPVTQLGEEGIEQIGDYLHVVPEVATAAFYHDCDPVTAAAAVSELTPERASTRLASVASPAWRSIPSAYVICTEDQALVPSVQQKMSLRAGAVKRIESGHAPMLSRPDELAQILADLACESFGTPKTVSS